MIADLMPSTAACAEAFEDSGEEDALFPEERALLGRSVEKRRREFATVRACARRALADLGLPPAPVLPGVRNAPRWPDGVVGSMTHCDGYRAAVLARSADLLAIGIDAEPDLPLPGGVRDSIALPAEQAWLRRADARRQPGPAHWDRLLFSAKEAVYKTWYPMMRTELDFGDAEITFGVDEFPASAESTTGTFDARLLRPARGPHGRDVTAFTGRWAAGRGLLVTAIAYTAFSPSVPPVASGRSHPV
ncbi:4'-phosphopantetheinyl transferase family protein [Streptomyces sp. AK02-01A]|uniref:4'-phosphopantetheinyl transferase family protein n=1 Tax=Streptomyces sp. AK02-01A TaxID=3028648 RepID=UPI0029B68864|nr:4'-phosphopantetheinyl transferase superfamily protein [Streptomyces sp. AK02-01A]MDX3852712.1 4'-phosphopantetheinyl transferase superfamily protein [Streptomyces sp. AK02-01A]